jgi:hypothetical protein
MTEKVYAILNELVLDVSSKPLFDPMRDCLFWEDEGWNLQLVEPERDVLVDLWIVRGFIHRQVPIQKWGVGEGSYEYFKGVWDEAFLKAPNWPGFKRLVLSKLDNEYLNTGLLDENPFD